MFKFDFSVNDIEKENPFKDKQAAGEILETLSHDSSIVWYESEEITPSQELLENLDVCKLNSTQKAVNGIHITHMVSGFLLEDIKDHESSGLDIKKAEDQHSDLIPGVYEGGAKIWECTEDLLNYLSENYTTANWPMVRVLDLGCGSGILGIYAFLNGANVTFQDYNKDVLEKITVPNVLLNTAGLNDKNEEELYDIKNLKDKVRFFSGDWEKWNELSKDIEKFDIILTCETIYNPRNHQKLLNCIHEKLKPDGKVYVAAKIHYFGVGGGLRQFEQLIEKDKRFNYKVVWQSNEGVNREIVQLTNNS